MHYTITFATSTYHCWFWFHIIKIGIVLFDQINLSEIISFLNFKIRKYLWFLIKIDLIVFMVFYLFIIITFKLQNKVYYELPTKANSDTLIMNNKQTLLTRKQKPNKIVCMLWF